jgi:hypothetical protein
MSTLGNKYPSRLWFLFLALAQIAALSAAARAQTCLTSDDLDSATQTALVNTAKSFFGMMSKGDSATLQQNAIASLASNFAGIEALVNDNKANFASATATAKPPFELQAQGAAPVARAEFLCGIFSATGQTANSTIITIPNLPPGNYGLVVLDVATPKGPYTVTFILQQEGTAWKLGGLFVRDEQIQGHNSAWFLQQAQAYKAKGQNLDAWFYYQEARMLMVPVDFMSTMITDKVYQEAQAAKPALLPPSDLTVNGKTYKLIAMFPLTVGNDLDLIVRYDSPDVSDTAKAFADNMAVIHGLVDQHPELRQAFGGIVARATAPSGQDYGSLLPMNEIK